MVRATEIERTKETSCSRFQKTYLKICIERENDTLAVNTTNECRLSNLGQDTAPSQHKHHATDHRIVSSFLKNASIAGSSKVHFLFQDTCGSAQTNRNLLMGWKGIAQLENYAKIRKRFLLQDRMDFKR